MTIGANVNGATQFASLLPTKSLVELPNDEKERQSFSNHLKSQIGSNDVKSAVMAHKRLGDHGGRKIRRYIHEAVS